MAALRCTQTSATRDSATDAAAASRRRIGVKDSFVAAFAAVDCFFATFTFDVVCHGTMCDVKAVAVEAGKKKREVTLKGPLGNVVTFTVDQRVKRRKEVKVGDHVADGDNLLDLYNGRQLHLEANAIGSEILLLDNVFAKDLLIDAVPIGGSSSAILSKLKI